MDRLESILDKHIVLRESSNFVKLMVQTTNSDVEETVNYLKDLFLGFKESR